MKKISIVFFVVIFCVFSFVAQATLVKSANLEQLVAFATHIVKAKVVSRVVELDDQEAGGVVVYYTLEIKEWIKGTPLTGNEAEMVIKQMASGEFTNNGQTIRQNYSFPEYKVGQEYVLFLPTPHHKTGLLAPVGLFQGVYQISKNETGQETIPEYKTRATMLTKGLVKNANNKFVTKGLSAAAAGSDFSYESFKAVIKSMQGDE